MGASQQQASLQRRKLVSLGVGLAIGLCSGSVYGFGLISSPLKTLYHMSSKEIDLIYSFGATGQYFGMPAGLVFDSYGPRLTCFIGMILGLFGYFGFGWILHTSGGYPSSFVIGLCFACVGQASTFMYYSALFTNVKLHPATRRGSIVGILAAGCGLSAAFFGLLYEGMMSGSGSEWKSSGGGGHGHRRRLEETAGEAETVTVESTVAMVEVEVDAPSPSPTPEEMMSSSGGGHMESAQFDAGLASEVGVGGSEAGASEISPLVVYLWTAACIMAGAALLGVLFLRLPPATAPPPGAAVAVGDGGADRKRRGKSRRGKAGGVRRTSAAAGVNVSDRTPGVSVGGQVARPRGLPVSPGDLEGGGEEGGVSSDVQRPLKGLEGESGLQNNSMPAMPTVALKDREKKGEKGKGIHTLLVPFRMVNSLLRPPQRTVPSGSLNVSVAKRGVASSRGVSERELVGSIHASEAGGDTPPRIDALSQSAKGDGGDYDLEAAAVALSGSPLSSAGSSSELEEGSEVGREEGDGGRGEREKDGGELGDRTRKAKSAQKGSNKLLALMTRPEFILTGILFVLVQGSCAMFIGNAGLFGEALGLPADTATSVVKALSYANCAGRLVAGLSMDFSASIVPPSAFFIITCGIFCSSQMLLLLATPGSAQTLSLFFASAIGAGLCYGANFAIVPTFLASSFGPEPLGSLYASLVTTLAVVTTGFNMLAGSVYDREFERQKEEANLLQLLVARRAREDLEGSTPLAIAGELGADAVGAGGEALPVPAIQRIEQADLDAGVCRGRGCFNATATVGFVGGVVALLCGMLLLQRTGWSRHKRPPGIPPPRDAEKKLIERRD
uniref:Nodulin-like domain-containing protein n=1 Tax=Chromera velia CCMP2878 TaxID=1169474 RepID=A0A0G4GGP1_9ALVE|eukprot:Cvel_21820.t1-p1 / transcript=Cvel_21820.t1 / gene=Cvel_21820 / organism=Chromera_velia_CCMP2878 / gene_product=Probable transporter MCH1, putative / transcript_product=Probable transporter MCH1, putative / location=Cvel_scaffold2081:8185-13181(-) / protein_length=841 / sequence_SO=supercontig / SO=protein_coding / is_pseudo=false